jgi:hypothetical protein
MGGQHSASCGRMSSAQQRLAIGNIVIVLPMSVVTGDVPDNGMVGGSLARILRTIDEEWLARYREKNGILQMKLGSDGPAKSACGSSQ